MGELMESVAKADPEAEKKVFATELAAVASATSFFPEYFDPDKVPDEDRRIWERLKEGLPRKEFEEWKASVVRAEESLKGDAWNNRQYMSSRAWFLEFVAKSVENFAKEESNEAFCRLKPALSHNKNKNI